LTFRELKLIFKEILRFLLERPYMKKLQILAVMGLTLALTVVVRAQEYVKPAAITVVGVHGEARYSIDGKAWHPLVVGKILRQGSVLETAVGSTVDLILSGNPVPVPENSAAPQSLPMVTYAPDPEVRGYIAYKPMTQQNVIRMGSGTMLAVDQLTTVDTGADTVGNTELDLRAGKIFFSVKKLSATSQYIIKLPNGVAGIRGAAGSISADDSFMLSQGSGVISIILNGRSIVEEVTAGNGFNPATGQVGPLSPQILSILSEFGAFAQTVYQQLASLAVNLDCRYLSNTQGKFPNHIGHPGPPPGGGGEGGGVLISTP
jgi:FecR protein